MNKDFVKTLQEVRNALASNLVMAAKELHIVPSFEETLTEVRCIRDVLFCVEDIQRVITDELKREE